MIHLAFQLIYLYSLTRFNEAKYAEKRQQPRHCFHPTLRGHRRGKEKMKMRIIHCSPGKQYANWWRCSSEKLSLKVREKKSGSSNDVLIVLFIVIGDSSVPCYDTIDTSAREKPHVGTRKEAEEDNSRSRGCKRHAKSGGKTNS